MKFSKDYLRVLGFHTRFSVGSLTNVMFILALETAGLFMLASAFSSMFLFLTGTTAIDSDTYIGALLDGVNLLPLACALGVLGAISTFASEKGKAALSAQIGFAEFVSLGVVDESHSYNFNAPGNMQVEPDVRVFGGPLHYSRAVSAYLNLIVPSVCIFFSVGVMHFFLEPLLIWLNLGMLTAFGFFYYFGLKRVESVEREFRRTKGVYLRSRTVSKAETVNELFMQRNVIQASNRMRFKLIVFLVVILAYYQMATPSPLITIDQEALVGNALYLATAIQLFVLSTLRLSGTVSQSIRFFPFIAAKLSGDRLLDQDDLDD